MAAPLMGISSSPIPESNTDRAVKEILERSNLEYEFTKLSALHIEPCRACQGCTQDNSCVIQDNGRVLAERFARARAFVLGCYTSYGSLDSRTKMFMERMYCLRHVRSKNRGKLGIAVLTTASGDDEEPARIAKRQIEMWMDEEGIRNLGILVVPGSGPCVRCGNEQCVTRSNRVPGTAPAPEGLEIIKLEPTLLTHAADLARQLREALPDIAPVGAG